MILEESLVGSPLVQIVWQRLQVTQKPVVRAIAVFSATRKNEFDATLDLTAKLSENQMLNLIRQLVHRVRLDNVHAKLPKRRGGKNSAR